MVVSIISHRYYNISIAEIIHRCFLILSIGPCVAMCKLLPVIGGNLVVDLCTLLDLPDRIHEVSL